MVSIVIQAITIVVVAVPEGVSVLAQKSFESVDDINAWKEGVDSAVYEIIVENITINSSAFEDKDEKGNLDFVGSKTECALLGFSKRFGVDYNTYRHENKQVKVYPFASQRKTMTSIIKLGSSSVSLRGKATASNAEYRVLVKGASEMVLSSCTHFVDAQGQTQEFDKDSKLKFEQTISNFANKALRTIGMAYLVLGGQFLIVEYGGVAFGTTKLTWYQWLVTVLIGSLSLPIGLIIRLLPNFCVPESILNEDFKPSVSEAKMQWESGVEKLRVFSKLRKPIIRGSSGALVDSKSKSKPRSGGESKPKANFANIVSKAKNQQRRGGGETSTSS
ncbi:18357_t:CDS:2 [Entrophospora sp. SA101]|nr:18357_t:CDS:2 [Entrophospora sp. SA101]